MTTMFWVLFVVAVLLFLHPYVTYPLSLRLMPERTIRMDPALPRPSATLLFSAYNEEKALPAKLRNIEEIKALYPDLDVIAYCDKSRDRTLEILQSRPDLLRVMTSPERTGKATGMRMMVAAADTDICIFTDANVRLDPASVAPLLDCFRDPAVGGVSGKLRYTNEDDGTTASVGALYWRLEEHIKALESRCGSMMGADGSIFATRRSTYPDVPAHLLDDMIASMSVVFAGYRLISGANVIAYEKSATDGREEFRRKRRIACRAYNSHRHIRGQVKARFGFVDRYKYVSHKLLRWFGAPLLAIAAGSLTGALLMGGHAAVVLALWLVGAGMALLGWAGMRPFASLWGIFLSIVATFTGIVDALHGNTYQTWEPAQSRN
ncbi:glycosyltransferase [Sphingobium subterraneum]|uniref:Cellulose synthase/poly-beta-1,6-N-acetylglucosamine synthase-like glycosyltransferase n=1 Tax=Sphingobium subterraneum TaxID=627688 RepID=A0A841IWF2_9SPHN|nr:glycosyltransferase [Sphingobium subterraneum]MBB6123259.1 cellulose synthase/poly-beta-1,6-N-acetylglucosamine synthase-like glycosyltransferase [Sphingobium subterraneum]